MKGLHRHSLPVAAKTNGEATAERMACIAASDRSPLGVLVTDAHGRCIYSNTAYRQLSAGSSEALFGSHWATLLGSHWATMIHPHERKAVLRRWQRARRTGKPFLAENRLLRLDGALVWTRRHIARVDETCLESGHVHTVEDISTGKSMQRSRDDKEKLLVEERERAQVTLESIGDAVLGTDAAGRVTYMNRVAERMTGWPRDLAVGRPLAEVFRIVEASTYRPAPNPALRAMERECVVGLAANSVLLQRDGGEIAIEDSAAPIHDRAGRVTGAVVVFHDARFSEQAVQKMMHLARHDALTGLPNRVTLEDRLSQALKSASRYPRRVGLLFLDLDNFKQINDTFGHVFGDRLLADLAARLLSCIRTADTLCRYGGDEFAVLLSEIVRPEDAHRVARKLQETAAMPCVIDGHEVTVSLSVGISVYPEDGQDALSLLQKADAAMYQTKGAQRLNGSNARGANTLTDTFGDRP